MFKYDSKKPIMKSVGDTKNIADEIIHRWVGENRINPYYYSKNE